MMVRVPEGIGESERSTQERLQFLEDKLERMEQALGELGRILGTLVEKSGEGSQNRTVVSDGHLEHWIY